VLQDSGCSYVVSPESITAAAAGGGARVDVATAAACAWTAGNATAAWITVTGPASGDGSGAVELSFGPNPGPARVGTIAVAGRTITVSQENGCAVSLSATSQSMPASGGASSLAVSAGAGCAWTAVSDVPWMVITDGAAGSGGGTVHFAVDANATGAQRTGTVTVSNAVFTLTQQ
jgi:hypothetical protein